MRLCIVLCSLLFATVSAQNEPIDCGGEQLDLFVGQIEEKNLRMNLTVQNCLIGSRSIAFSFLRFINLYFRDVEFEGARVTKNMFQNARSWYRLQIRSTNLEFIEPGGFDTVRPGAKKRAVSIELIDNPRLRLVKSMFTPVVQSTSLVIVNSNVDGDGIATDLFNGLMVENLTLDNAGLQQFPNRLLQPVANSLVSLSLQGNQISNLAISLDMPKLKSLYLQNSSIVTIDANSFRRVPNLQWLSLESNQVNELPAGLFASNLQLKSVSLKTNTLTRLDSTVLSWERVQELNLAENFWDCSCELLRLLKRVPGNKTLSTATCSTPLHFKGSTLLQLGNQPCDPTTPTTTTTSTTTTSTTTTTTTTPTTTTPTTTTTTTTTRKRTTEAAKTTTRQTVPTTSTSKVPTTTIFTSTKSASTSTTPKVSTASSSTSSSTSSTTTQASQTTRKKRTRMWESSTKESMSVSSERGATGTDAIGQGNSSSRTEAETSKIQDLSSAQSLFHNMKNVLLIVVITVSSLVGFTILLTIVMCFACRSRRKRRIVKEPGTNAGAPATNNNNLVVNNNNLNTLPNQYEFDM